MSARASAIVLLLASLLARTSAAGPAETHEARSPGYFNGIGVEGRTWELRSDTGLGAHRVLTQRFEIAGALSVPWWTRVYIVPRVAFGLWGSIKDDVWLAQGPLFSIGVRQRSPRGRYWAEAGVRVVPSYSGPYDTDPVAQRIAFDAAQTSGVADDATWLPMSAWGGQAYGAFQSRTGEWHNSLFVALIGAEYGGRISLGPMSVRTWLGTQRAMIGSFYVEPFVTTRKILGNTVNLQLGLHVEASLSSIWPGERSLPVHVSGFLGWSPAQWFALRLSGGGALAPLDTSSGQFLFGVRAQIFAP